MTGDELASALYAEQGYLIAGTWEPRRIGELIEDNIPKYGDCSPTKTPLRVIGDATEGDARQQAFRMAKILKVAFRLPRPRAHYYRVEAAD